MAKGLSAIQAQLEQAAGRKSTPPPAPEQDATPAATPPAQSRAAAKLTSTKPKSREGLVHCGAWLPEAFSRNILLVRAKTGLPVKTIYANALNELFRAHGVPVVDED